ncbi:protein xylosyltransferase [Aureococcus anophagefferens]|nr:protein xylosyltransferase [Aureococcus anophagefferens]
MRALRGLLCCLACVNAESGCDVLARLAKDEPVLAVAFATASYASLAANWALSAARVGLPHALLELEGPAGASGVPDAVAVASISPAAAHAFAENRGGGLSGLWLARALALEAILAPACLQSDVLVLHSDVDVVFLGDVAGPLVAAACDHCLGAGQYPRRSRQVADSDGLLRRGARAARPRRRSLERVVALTARLGDDQLALNHALDDLGFGASARLATGARAALLDAPSFPVGGCDRWLEVAAALEHGAAPRVLHPNCVDKAGGSKEAWLRSRGAWLLSDGWAPGARAAANATRAAALADAWGRGAPSTRGSAAPRPTGDLAARHLACGAVDERGPRAVGGAYDVALCAGCAVDDVARFAAGSLVFVGGRFATTRRGSSARSRRRASTSSSSARRRRRRGVLGLAAEDLAAPSARGEVLAWAVRRPGARPPPPRADPAPKPAGAALFEDGDYAAAYRAFLADAAAGAAGDRAEALFRAGVAAAAAGENGDAADRYDAAAAMDPRHDRAHEPGALAYAASDLAAAVGFLERAVFANPTNGAAVENLRVAQETAHRGAARRSRFDAVAGTRRGRVRGRARRAAGEPALAARAESLGVLDQAAGRADEAEARYGRAVALDPGLAAAWNNLGILKLHGDDVEDGVRCLGEAARLDGAAYGPNRAFAARLADRSRELAAPVFAAERRVDVVTTLYAAPAPRGGELLEALGRNAALASVRTLVGHWAGEAVHGYDAFVFLPPAPAAVVAALAGVYQNRLGADLRVVDAFVAAGYDVLNPCLQVAAFHLHCSRQRTYAFNATVRDLARPSTSSS